MAAHIITAMNEITSSERYLDKESLSSLEFHFGHAIFGNQLELDEYCILVALARSAIVDHEKAKYAIQCFWWKYMQDNYYKEWEKLNQPANYEEWMERKYRS